MMRKLVSPIIGAAFAASVVCGVEPARFGPVTFSPSATVIGGASWTNTGYQSTCHKLLWIDVYDMAATGTVDAVTNRISVSATSSALNVTLPIGSAFTNVGASTIFTFGALWSNTQVGTVWLLGSNGFIWASSPGAFAGVYTAAVTASTGEITMVEQTITNLNVIAVSVESSDGAWTNSLFSVTNRAAASRRVNTVMDQTRGNVLWDNGSVLWFRGTTTNDGCKARFGVDLRP